MHYHQNRHAFNSFQGPGSVLKTPISHDGLYICDVCFNELDSPYYPLPPNMQSWVWAWEPEMRPTWTTQLERLECNFQHCMLGGGGSSCRHTHAVLNSTHACVHVTHLIIHNHCCISSIRAAAILYGILTQLMLNLTEGTVSKKAQLWVQRDACEMGVFKTDPGPWTELKACRLWC